MYEGKVFVLGLILKGCISNFRIKDMALQRRVCYEKGKMLYGKN